MQENDWDLRENDWDLLLKRISDGRCTPFLGAGVSYGKAPLAADLARRWAQLYDYPLSDTDDLARVAQYVAVTRDYMLPKEELAREFANLDSPDYADPEEPHRVLAELPIPIYITITTISWFRRCSNDTGIHAAKCVYGTRSSSEILLR